ncbi:MAG: hypothetical protein KGJ98_13925 [Chloroflexota bacterium]|nr:hypothetical protein [Chloroflexota bacterium]
MTYPKDSTQWTEWALPEGTEVRTPMSGYVLPELFPPPANYFARYRIRTWDPNKSGTTPPPGAYELLLDFSTGAATPPNLYAPQTSGAVTIKSFPRGTVVGAVGTQALAGTPTSAAFNLRIRLSSGTTGIALTTADFVGSELAIQNDRHGISDRSHHCAPNACSVCERNIHSCRGGEHSH